MCSAPLARVSLVFLLLLSPMLASAQEASPRPPLKETDVVKLLVSRVSPARLRSLVQKYGIDFPVDPSLEVLRAAGADSDLIEALRAAEPTPTPMAVPPGRPSPTAAPTRTTRTTSPAPSLSTLDRDFALVQGGPNGDVYLARREVTNKDYWDYCTRWGVRRPPKPPLGKPLSNWPVVNVTFGEAVKYCDTLSREYGRKYRLPTEDEWELGARGGDSRKRYPWGDDSPKGRACFGGGVLCRVGTFKPNTLGLFDMAGSAAEWVTGKDTEPVVKGGSWADAFPEDNHKLAVSNREKPDPRKANYKVGFRIAMEP